VFESRPTTLRDLCAGRRRPMFSTLSALCQALKLSLEDVIAFAQECGPKP